MNISGKLRSLQKSIQQTWMPNYYLIIQCTQIRLRQVKPQINLIPYAMGYIFQKPLEIGICTICGFILSVYRNMCTHQNRPSEVLIIHGRLSKILPVSPFCCRPFFSLSGNSCGIMGRRRPMDRSVPFLIHCHVKVRASSASAGQISEDTLCLCS